MTGLFSSQDYETCKPHFCLHPSNDNSIYESSYSNRWPHPTETQIPAPPPPHTHTHTHTQNMGMHSMPANFTLREIVSGAEWIGSLVASRNGLQDIDIDLIPKIQIWLQPLNTEHVINKSMNVQVNNKSVLKRRISPIYNYTTIYIQYTNSFT
jgi:hypothetical protein